MESVEVCCIFLLPFYYLRLLACDLYHLAHFGQVLEYFYWQLGQGMEFFLDECYRVRHSDQVSGDLCLVEVMSIGALPWHFVWKAGAEPVRVLE
jgi:hypothetical protein